MKAAICFTRAFYSAVAEIGEILEDLGFDRCRDSRDEILEFLGKDTPEGRKMRQYWNVLDEHDPFNGHPAMWHWKEDAWLVNRLIDGQMEEMQRLAH